MDSSHLIAYLCCEFFRLSQCLMFHTSTSTYEINLFSTATVTALQGSAVCAIIDLDVAEL